MNLNNLNQVNAVAKRLGALQEAKTVLAKPDITLGEALDVVKGVGPGITAQELQTILQPVKDLLEAKITQARGALTALGVVVGP